MTDNQEEPMSTTTLTLTDFLLARIAEDEAEAQSIHHMGSDRQFSCSLYGGDYAETCDCGYPARVLAECEAKRRIVEEWTAAVLAPANGLTLNARNLDRAGILARAQALKDVMGLLALPYADHPDYEEWRA